MHCPTLSELPPPPLGKSGWSFVLRQSEVCLVVSRYPGSIASRPISLPE